MNYKKNNFEKGKGFTPVEYRFRGNFGFSRNYSAGFTLVEMLVVAVVFVMLMVGIMGIFVSAVKIQRYTLTAQHLIDQGSYAMEYMSRMLRMAKQDDVSGSCTGLPNSTYNLNTVPTTTVNGLFFKKYDDATCKAFFLNTGMLYEYDGSRADHILFLTSSKIEVVNFSAYVHTGSQPRVTIYLELKGKGVDPQPKMKLQTTVSQRDLNP
jgi:prepilin-type N-terminal cleavage/methylation domain-containing protein